MKVCRDTVQSHAPWSLKDIPYASIDKDRVSADEHLFYWVASASFVEITSDLYTDNLLEYFRGDAEVSQWLETVWQHDEMRHGTALKRYVATVWPQFDWEHTYRCFNSEYSHFCKTERLGPTRALEMVSRCLVETGTASLYTMLHRSSGEPVLRLLAAHITQDEVRHYKHFYQYFSRYRDVEKTGSLEVLRALWSRIGKIDSEDAYFAFKHVYQECHLGRRFYDSDYQSFRRQSLILARQHYPFSMAVKMALKPLGLNRRVKRAAIPLLLAGAKHLCR
jgi:hypothetical protein